jgi:membrane associated rhomboid family serine protease
LPAVASEGEKMVSAQSKLERFLTDHPELLADDAVREKLIKAGVLSQAAADDIAADVKRSPERETEYRLWLRGSEAQKLKLELDEKLIDLKNATEGSVYYQFAIAPNGDWKFHQLLTSAFLHGGLVHLFGNLIFFFAVAFSLEDLWGRGVFLTFYLLGAVVAALPMVISPISVPSLGASGAISATMGAFLCRLPKTRIKLFFIHFFWFRLLIFRKIAIYLVPGYIYLASYFIAQVILWYFDSRSGGIPTVGYSVHVAGFVYGAAFALVMKATKYEENYINPSIEAKVSFSAAPSVNTALKLLDQGDPFAAERTLRTHLSREPNDTNALLALIQVYQSLNNFDQLNAAYARLIRIHLNEHDKEAALYAYDSLLSAFPDDKVDPRIPVRDWLTICEYLRERQMHREAGVEYERLCRIFPDDALSGKAAVQGGEASMSAGDVERALRLFRFAQQLSLPTALMNRVEMGMERCEKIISHRPVWTNKPSHAPEFVRPNEDEVKL